MTTQNDLPLRARLSRFEVGRKFFDEIIDRCRTLGVRNGCDFDDNVRPFRQFAEGLQRPSFTLQRCNSAGKRTRSFELSADVLRGHIKMFAEQPVAKIGDDLRNSRIAACFESEIAFAVHAHRAVAEIRRADAQELVVNDHCLRVNVDTCTLLESGHMRIKDAAAIPAVHSAQFFNQPRTQGMHGVFLSYP